MLFCPDNMHEEEQPSLRLLHALQLQVHLLVLQSLGSSMKVHKHGPTDMIPVAKPGKDVSEMAG